MHTVRSAKLHVSLPPDVYASVMQRHAPTCRCAATGGGVGCLPCLLEQVGRRGPAHSAGRHKAASRWNRRARLALMSRSW